LRSRKEQREFDWMRLDSTLKKSRPRYISSQKISTLFVFTGYAWNRQPIFRFASIHGRACFILVVYSIKYEYIYLRSLFLWFLFEVHIATEVTPIYIFRLWIVPGLSQKLTSTQKTNFLSVCQKRFNQIWKYQYK
jgi:hypothetical protein